MYKQFFQRKPHPYKSIRLRATMPHTDFKTVHFLRRRCREKSKDLQRCERVCKIILT